MTRGAWFKGRQFTAEVILWAVRWYLMFPISYRDLELTLADRGVDVDHTTIFRWIQAYAPELEKRIRPHLRASNGSWRVDETYVRVKGRWMHLYHAVDSRGQSIDFLLAAKRDAEAAKRIWSRPTGVSTSPSRCRRRWKRFAFAWSSSGSSLGTLRRTSAAVGRCLIPTRLAADSDVSWGDAGRGDPVSVRPGAGGPDG